MIIDFTRPKIFFDSPDEAAVAFGQTYNSLSIARDREYAGSIYRRKTKNGDRYFHTKANVGRRLSVFPSIKLWKPYAVVHTHSAFALDKGNENYSSTDLRSANMFKVISYLVTPGGHLHCYEPRSKKLRRHISSDLPFDKNHPKRQPPRG